MLCVCVCCVRGGMKGFVWVLECLRGMRRQAQVMRPPWCPCQQGGERGGANEKDSGRKEGKRRKKAAAAPGCSSSGEAAELGSVEWWAHSRRGAGAGHQLHFDLDESALPAWREAEEAGQGGRSCPAPGGQLRAVP